MNPNRVDIWEYSPALSGLGREYPLDDYAAFERYPRFRWVYDKLALHRRFNSSPSDSSGMWMWDSNMVIKPRISLNGLAKNVIKSKFGLTIPPGYIGQELLSGIYRSTDYLITDDSVKLLYSYRARMRGLGEFYLFWKSNSIAAVSMKLAEYLKNKQYTGYLNVESIGENILEAHLRPAVQFWDRPKYSIVFRKEEDAVPYIEPEYRQGIKPSLNLPEIKSVQYCWSEGEPLSLSDPGKQMYRYLIVNSDKLREGIYYGNIISSQIKWKEAENSEER